MARATRSAGLLPLVIGIVSAAALTGAAYFTVDSAGCTPAQYVRHDDRIELVGGCVNGSELAPAVPEVAGSVTPGNYRP